MKNEITVLCIDDELDILASLKRLFRSLDIHLLFANNGEKALEILNTNQVDIVISDMRMPQMDGVELLSTVCEKWPNIYRILLTGFADMSSLKGAVNQGGIQCYIEKPWNNADLLEHIDTAIKDVIQARKDQEAIRVKEQQNELLNKNKFELEQRVTKRTNQVKTMLSKNKRFTSDLYSVLLNFVEIHPSLNNSFAESVSQSSKVFAHWLGLDPNQIKDIYIAGKLCQIGMMGIKNDYSRLPFNKLTYNQQQEYLSQVDHIHSLLSPAKALARVEKILVHQFVCVNGTGYPSLSVQADIPMESKLLAITRDFWRCKLGLMTSLRMSDFESLSELRKYRGTRYDPELLDAFSDLLQQNTLDTDFSNLDVASLKPGMILNDNLFDRKQRLLLPKGHIISAKCIEALKRIEALRKTRFSLDINLDQP